MRSPGHDLGKLAVPAGDISQNPVAVNRRANRENLQQVSVTIAIHRLPG
jgi:hypothetical protein